MKTLYPPQEQLVQHLAQLLRQRDAVINTSHTGTGKTLMTVELCRRLGLTPLVVCPKIVVPSWKKAFSEQGAELLGVSNYEKLRRGSTPWGRFPKDSKQFEWNEGIDTIVWDEAHRCKDTKSSNAWMMARAKGKKNILLSATLAENPAEMKAAGYLLDLHRHTNFAIWAKARGCSFDPWGKLKFTTNPERAQEILADLNAELYPACGGALSREDMGEFFSRTSIITEPLDFGDDGKIATLYEEMETYLASVEAKELEDTDNPAAAALVQLLRARQKVELLKLPLLIEFVKEAWGEGHHVAVFLNFNDSIVALQEKLGGSYPVIWGTDPLSNRTQTAKERARHIEAFQSNSVNLILVNTQAGGVAIDLHDIHGGAPRMTLISPSFNAKDVHQVLGRCDRAGAKSPSIQRILFAADTVEEEVRLALERKLENLSSLLTPPPIQPAAAVPRAKKEPEPPKERPLEQRPLPADYITGPWRQTKNSGEAHAHFGPSSLAYFERCPSYCSPNEPDEENEEEERDDEDSAEIEEDSVWEEGSEIGTRLHEACEHEDLSLCKNDREEHLVGVTLEAVENISQLFGITAEAGAEILREETLDIETHHASTFGTVDRIQILGDEALVFDYKFGVMPVDEAIKNAQAQAYVAGVFQRWPEVNRVRFFFLAPVADTITGATFLRSPELIDELEFLEDEEVGLAYPEILLRIDLIISRAIELRNKEWHPAPSLCEFCGNRLRCKPLADKVLLLAREHNEDELELPEIRNPNHVEDPDTIARLMLLSRVIKPWLDEVRRRARYLAFTEGYEIPGHTKRYKKKSRKLENPLAVYHLLVSDGVVTEDDFMQAIRTVKYAPLEEAGATRLAELHDVTKAEAKEMFDALLRNHELLSGGTEDSEYGYLQIDRNIK